MLPRLLAILFIYVCTTVAWLILGGTVFMRSEQQGSSLRSAVQQIWGQPQVQKAPTSTYRYTVREAVNRTVNGKETSVVEDVVHFAPVTLASAKVDVDFDLDQRRKGLMWYSTYKVAFRGAYVVKNETKEPHVYSFTYAFPGGSAIYDDFHLVQGGKEAPQVAVADGSISREFTLAPGQSTPVVVSYRTQGLDTWSYEFGEGVTQVRNFDLTMKTDFDRIDFPPDGASPTEKREIPGGWELAWKHKNLLTAVKIGMEMPKRLNPGPWVGQVTLAAPVSLFLFFFLVFVITAMRGIRLHPMHYFFLASGFFAFHLLLSYSVDHLPVEWAVALASLVSVGLVVSYMRLVVSARFAYVEVALAQLVYLVLFSCTFFLEGYTGLAITILCIATLFVVMQVTAKIDWEQVFASTLPAKKPPKPELPPT